METWEIVLILALLTISIIVISKHKVPTQVITLLDSPIFQIAILGLTLAAAVNSPPVAIVAISTLVLVYYMRNIVKIQIVSANAQPLHVPQMAAVIEEKRVTTIVNTEEPKYEKNSDVIETALKESEMRPPVLNHEIIGNKATINGQLSFPVEPVRHQENFEDPRGSISEVESFDTQASFHSKAYSSNSDRSVLPEVDSDVFRRSERNPEAANENVSAPEYMRTYNDKNGQYGIEEPRPTNMPDKYEVAYYKPDEFIGANNFVPVGNSINDKITNLSRSKFVTSNPPPDYDMAVPSKMF